MEINERLRLARVRAGFETAKDAAARLHIPYGTYSGHEAGTRGIKKDEIERYARSFDVDVAWLAFGLGGDFQIVTHTARHIGKINSQGLYEQFGDINKPDFKDTFPALPVEEKIQAVVSVEGEMLHGFAEDGWLIYLSIKDVHNIESKINVLCMCHTGDDEKGSVIGRPQRSAKNHIYNIERINQPTIRDTPIIGAQYVLGVMSGIAKSQFENMRKTDKSGSLNFKSQMSIPPFREYASATSRRRETAKSI